MNRQDQVVTAPESRGRPGRKPSGQVIVRQTQQGPPAFSLRVTAYGQRHQFALGPQVTTRAQAEEELANVLADVRRGTWRPTSRQPVPEATGVPTFHEFSSEWFERHRREVRERTIEHWLWLLSGHLLPFFSDYPLDAIAPELVDRFKVAKLQERERYENGTKEERLQRLVPVGLNATSINKAMALLARILDEAIDYGHPIERNPAKGRSRRLKPIKPPRTFLEPHEAQAVLDATSEKHRPLLATMILAGLRVGELIALRWRDVDLAGGKLRVTESKTADGVRVIDLSPMLREELPCIGRTPGASVTTISCSGRARVLRSGGTRSAAGLSGRQSSAPTERSWRRACRRSATGSRTTASAARSLASCTRPEPHPPTS